MAAPLLITLLPNTLGKAVDDDPSIWAHVTHQ